jgi:hypothetical protein
MTPEELIKHYPFLDHLMASTILNCHEAGTLDKIMQQYPMPEKQEEEEIVIQNAITIEEKNSCE